MKSAFQLGLELIRSNQGKDFNFNAYYPKITAFYRWLEIKQLKKWLLVFINNHNPVDLDDLKQKSADSLDFENNITLQYIGKNQAGNFPEKIESAIKKIKQDNLVTFRKKIEITKQGQLALNKILKSNSVFGLRNLFIKITGLVIGIISFFLIHIGGIYLITYFDLPSYFRISLRLSSLDKLSLFEVLLPLGALGIFTFGLLRFLNIYTSYHRLLKNNQQNKIELLENGIYSRYRHPMYGSFILMQNGIFLGFPSIWTLLPALILTLLNFINGWWEEKFVLKPSLGQNYSNYKEKVKRKYLSIISWIFLAILYVYHFSLHLFF